MLITYRAKKYLFKVKNKDVRLIEEKSSKLTIRTN